MCRISFLLTAVLGVFLFAWGVSPREGSAQEGAASRIIIESVKLPQNDSAAFINRYGLTRDDLRNIRKHADGIKRIIPMRMTVVEARYGSETADALLCGTDENFSHKLNPGKLDGRFLLDKDVDRLNNVAVVGDRVAQALFGNSDPVGRNIRMGKDYYLIVGRLELTAFQQDFSPEELAGLSRSIFIPLSTMRARLGDDQIVRREGAFSAESFELSYVEIVPDDPQQTGKLVNQVQRLLRMNHPQQDYRLQVLR